MLQALKNLRHNLELKDELERSTTAPLWLRWTRSPAALVLVLLVAALALAVPFYRHRNLTTSSPPEKSIAVLPFADLSEAKDQEYFCDGISEEILDGLAKVDGLRVVGRTSSFSFKGKNANVSEVGKKLNVANVLEGTLRREGNRVRITAELINTRNGFHLWSETYERELQGVFAVQDEITRSIVEALKVKLAVSLPVHEQRNTEAYELYLQGLFFSNKSSEADLRRALSFFQSALEKDPTFSRAWTGIAKVWYFLADVYVKPLEAYPASREAALKAIALDENDAEAHCYLSEAKRVLDWDLEGADAELKRALELDPNSAPAHFFLALLPLFRGELQEGLRLVLEAEKLDPVSPITSYVATAAYLANDRIDDAINEGQRTLLLDPNYFYLDSNLAAAYREKGNFAEAIALYTKSQEATHLPEQRPCHHLHAHGSPNRGAKYSCSAPASEGEAIRLGACDRRSLRRPWRQRRSFPLARTRLCRALGNTTVDRVSSRISSAPFRRAFPSSSAANRRFAELNFGDHRDNSVRD